MPSAEATLKLLLLGVDRGAGKMFHNVGNEAEGAGRKGHKFGVVAAAGLLAAGTAAVAFGKKSVNAYRDTAKESIALSRVTGLSIKQSSQLRFAAEETGIEFKTLSTSTRLFAKNVSAAAPGTTKYRDLVKQLGFATRDAHGQLLPMSDLLSKVADRFKHMPDGPEKTALAMKLFGRSGADMIRLLNQGSSGLAKFAEESDKTGNSLSNVDGYKKTLQAQREFHAATMGLQVTLGAALYPILTKLALFLTAHVAPAIMHVTAFFHEHQAAISKVAPVVGILVAALVGLLTYLKFIKFAMLGVNLVMDANPISLVVIAVAALAVGLIYAYKHSEKFRDIVDGTFKVISKGASLMWDYYLKPILKMWLTLWFTVVGALLNGAAKAFGWVPGIGGKLKAAAREFNKFKNSVNNSLDGIHDKKVRFSIVMSARDRALLDNPHASPFVTSAIAAPHHAVGSRNFAGGLTWVGERGPELVSLPRGASIATAADSARMGSGSDDLGTLTVIVASDTGEVIEKKLAVLKRTKRGGKTLAFV